MALSYLCVPPGLGLLALGLDIRSDASLTASYRPPERQGGRRLLEATEGTARGAALREAALGEMRGVTGGWLLLLLGGGLYLALPWLLPPFASTRRRSELAKSLLQLFFIPPGIVFLILAIGASSEGVLGTAAFLALAGAYFTAPWTLVRPPEPA